MFVVFGIKAIPKAPQQYDVLEVAAVTVDQTGSEVDSFQSLVAQEESFLAGISPKALESTGLTIDELRQAPSPENAAKGLRTFLGRNQNASLIAYNLDRAKRLLEKAPWMVTQGWKTCIRKQFFSMIGEEDNQGIKLCDAAQLLKIPVPLKRSALTAARISVEILGKMERRVHNISDADFLREAEYIMEDCL